MDLVILNGRVITFDGPDAEALAIKDGKVAAVGTTADIRRISNGAPAIDAAGNTVLPGFIDSHVHLFAGSVELEYLNLLGVSGVHALTAAIQPYAASRPDDTVVIASALDYDAMGDRAVNRHDLDQVIPDRPFAAVASDHHTVWANTKALELAGLLHGKDVGEGAEVVMGADGLATGELLEPDAYGDLMSRTAYGGREMAGLITGSNPLPAPSDANRAVDKAVIAKGLQHCASRGITGLHNMDGNYYQLELLSSLQDDGDLLCRTEVPMHLRHFDSPDRIDEAVEMRANYHSDMLWSARVKMFMDGVIDSRTAYMLQPYPGTDSCSVPLYDADTFNDICVRADAQGLQISVHAIGDAAVRQTLDGYDAAQRANGARDSRHRIEHIEAINPDDIPRFAELGVVASMQPLHSPQGGFFPATGANAVLHDEQIKYAFGWRTLRNAGAKLIFSTDWPVVPVDVMPTIQGAVAGAGLTAPWTDQRISLRDALSAYTRDNAWVEFNEAKKGKLRAGMMADIVVLDQNLDAMEPDQLGTAKAAVTICGGRITYRAS